MSASVCTGGGVENDEEGSDWIARCMNQLFLFLRSSTRLDGGLGGSAPVPGVTTQVLGARQLFADALLVSDLYHDDVSFSINCLLDPARLF